jgi:AcrR family transcriptional regulator
MRAVARASGLKLGALQYHFPTWQDLLRGVADYISHQYFDSHAELSEGEHHPKLADIVQFILDDEPGDALNSNRFFPQLWAMALVEPIMNDLLGEIYGHYLDILEKALIDADIPTPRVHARVLMALLESSSLFLAWDSRAKNIKKSERELVLAYVDSITSD